MIGELIEMSFDAGKTDKFMHPGRKRHYEEGTEELNAALPDLTRDEQSYLEYVTSQTYQKMVTRIERYLGKDADNISVPSLVSLMFQSAQDIQELESSHIKDLEELALETVLGLKEFELVKEAVESGQVKIDAKIDHPSLKQPSTDPKEGLSEAEKLNLDFAKELEDVSVSRAKRRLANLMIQGGAMLKMYLFKAVGKEINSIDPSLMKMYEVLAVTAQLGYWLFQPDMEISDDMAEDALAGSESAEPEGGIYVIKARGICFPYLIHEITKGIYEWISINSDQQKAMTKDSVSQEPDDLIVGPEIFSIVQKQVKNQKLLPLVIKKMVAQDLDDSKEIIGETPKGKEIIAKLEAEADSEWSAYEEERDSATD